MRTIFVIFAIVCVASAFDISKFASLVQTGTRANDAVESVYNMLRDLKTENLQVQVAADHKNITDEEIGTGTIKSLTTVANMNKAVFVQAKAHSDSVATQIKDIQDWQVWAEARLIEMERKAEALREQRCYSNALFVKSLKDHTDALNVVNLLKHDLSGYLTGAAPALVQVATTSVADKLAQFAHVFQHDAMTKFLQLTSSLTQEKQAGDNVAQQVFNVLLDLESQLASTLAYLQEQEIAAAFALAKWYSDTGAEKNDINQNQERKANLEEKLDTAYPAALAQQAKAKQMYEDTVNAINGAVLDLQEKSEFYAQETERRNEENAIIDECIAVFKEQVRNLVSGTNLKL